MWGGLFDVLLEKYGWTLHYVLWEISYTNIQMLMADAIQSFTNTGKDEIAGDAKISGDDARNMDLIMSIVND